MKPRNPYVVELRFKRSGAIKSRKNKLIKKEMEKEIEEWEEDYFMDMEEEHYG